jgi:hypothetical protein
MRTVKYGLEWSLSVNRGRKSERETWWLQLGGPVAGNRANTLAACARRAGVRSGPDQPSTG